MGKREFTAEYKVGLVIEMLREAQHISEITGWCWGLTWMGKKIFWASGAGNIKAVNSGLAYSRT